MKDSTIPRLLIYTIPTDYHAFAVAWALKRFGVQCDFWMAGDLPDYCGLTVRFDEGGKKVTLRQRGLDRAIRVDDVQLIWNRRFAFPTAPDWADAADRDFVENQCYEHMNGIRQLLGRQIRTINSPLAQSTAARKTVQIEEARRAGFHTPVTLISNDYAEIVDFWKTFSPLVVKPFKVAAWKRQSRVYAFYTAPMVEPTEDLRAELELSPQIFQQRVERAREVRVIAFGERAYAMEVRAATDTGLSLDLRYDMQNGVVSYLCVPIPASLRHKIRIYMDALKIEYGAFDFVIDQEGHWYFLECNEGGQFLYLETALPEIPMLDGFARWVCEILGVKDIGAVPIVTLKEFEAEGGCELNCAPGVHKRGVTSGYFFQEEAVAAS